MNNKYFKIVSIIVYSILITTYIALILGYIGCRLAFPIMFLGTCILLIKQAIINYRKNKKGLSLLSTIAAIFAIITSIFWILK
ncbi:hypothetical protein CLTEP_26390 [Clostridium tepidiprofundi DSM 19306]|uniref:Uncharacterized protein n=1 Tax=Clostridium tepidiprofundi DSM 19306 TaxID=1121338 RepID=A0A151AS48_9CLOT|nr:hypothetical protein [Clostridium tepidiprofundi]KYH30474.1 hypothetical protein CLTEP_26390 [Clostridium tepidiprofundi DSM 19306]